jgi:hypothetical protein
VGFFNRISLKKFSLKNYSFKNLSSMNLNLRKIGFILVPLTLLISFQNCTMGFNSADLSSEGTNLQTLEELQNKALGVLTTHCQTCHIQQSLGGVSNIATVSHLLSTRLIVPVY